MTRSAAIEAGPDLELSAGPDDDREAVGPDLARPHSGMPGGGACQNRARPDLACEAPEYPQIPTIDACRALGAAVLAHAVSEALAPPSRDRKRREAQLEARAWLLGETPGLEFWADVAGLDAEAITSRLAVKIGRR